jgi:flavin-dependent dehydrogenase
MDGKDNYEVLVIGAGPAGSTAAALLAEKGRRVLVLEKQQFPRYKIGESLIPFCYFTLERLGLIEKLRNSHFTKKYSVQFVTTDGRLSTPFYFSQHLDHPCSETWQVPRSEFDQMLVENAQGKGAEFRFGARVKDLLREEDRVVGLLVEDDERGEYELRAPIAIDASGREALSVHKYDWRVKDPELNKMAVWTYYKGAKRDPGMDEGATTVAYVPEKGWFWYIPLPGDVVSVGIVAEPSYLYRDGREPEKMFQREIDNNPWIAEHLAPGTQTGEYRITSDYSYRSRYSAIDGLVLTGDAFAFLDPVFSSGVFLALKGGEMAADAVDESLTAGDVSAEQFNAYSEKLCHGIEMMRNLVYAFYDQNFSFKEVLMKYPDLKGDMTDCLIGNFATDFDRLFAAIGEFAKLPAPLPHGRPLQAVS